MNKLYKFLVVATVSAGPIFQSSTVSAQAVEQGNILIDTYYGFPNLAGALIKNLTTETSAQTSILGPVGGRFEYMVSDKMGVGLESNYAKVGVTWEESFYDSYDSTTNVYAYEFSWTSLRFMPRFNIHFGSSDNFDGYFGIAAGYRVSKINSKATNNGVEDPDYDFTFTAPAPFALRVAVGGRYYFTPNIGINMELGFGGGALVHAGASFKF